MDKTTRFLKYAFDEEEKKVLANEMALAVLSKDAAEDELVAVRAQISSRVKEAQGKLSSVAEKLRSGYEYRQIDCEIEKDFVAGKVRITRIDTGEIVEERKISDADAQQAFM